VPMRSERRDGLDEALKFVPSRDVLFVALPPCISRMKSKPNLALDSSSIGGRVRSKKQRSRVGPSESTDSSGSSLDLTVEVKNSSHVVAEAVSPSVEVDRFLPVGPLSSIGVEEVANWRAKRGSTTQVLMGAGLRSLLSSTFLDVPCVDSSLGRRTNERVLKLPIERCQVPFLVSREALERCNIWGNMSGPKVKKHWRNTKGLWRSHVGVPFDPGGSAGGGLFCLHPIHPDRSSPGDVSVVPLGERMDDHDSLRADLAALTSQLREEKDDFLAKKKEIKALRLKVRNQDEARMLAASEKVSLREQLERREEEVCDLRCAAETFDVEKTMATSEAEFQGLPAPSFEGEPVIPDKTEAEKTQEPAADDPPAD
ncbi:hypothetical protein HID58_067047, partial [Brassica napus]